HATLISCRTRSLSRPSILFSFSTNSRPTRRLSHWSSHVSSSDLPPPHRRADEDGGSPLILRPDLPHSPTCLVRDPFVVSEVEARSEERRVGKGCRAGGWGGDGERDKCGEGRVCRVVAESARCVYS